MDDYKPTTHLMSRCLTMLKTAEVPATAAELAGRLALPGSRETQRRHIRTVIAWLRNRGHWIVATLTGGYWLTRDEAMWKDYLEHRSIDGKRIIGEASRRKKIMLTDKSGQGILFAPMPTTGI